MIRYLGGVERAPESSSLLQNTELGIANKCTFNNRLRVMDGAQTITSIFIDSRSHIHHLSQLAEPSRVPSCLFRCADLFYQIRVEPFPIEAAETRTTGSLGCSGVPVHTSHGSGAPLKYRPGPALGFVFDSKEGKKNLEDSPINSVYENERASAFHFRPIHSLTFTQSLYIR